MSSSKRQKVSEAKDAPPSTVEDVPAPQLADPDPSKTISAVVNGAEAKAEGGGAEEETKDDEAPLAKTQITTAERGPTLGEVQNIEHDPAELAAFPSTTAATAAPVAAAATNATTAAPAAAAGPRFSDEHVWPKFLTEYPGQTGDTWVPVSELVERLSPQSGKVRQALNLVYGNTEAAWNGGWRWMRLENNHQWYPPVFDDAEYTALVTEKSRGGKNKGSVTSPSALKLIELVANLI